MKNLIFAILVMSLGFISCKKETITPTNNTTQNGNGNNQTGITNYIWISLSTSNELNNLDSIVYDDGTGNMVTLSGTAAQSIFIQDGNGYYTNIEITGQEGYNVDVCIYMTPKTPIGFGYFNYYADVRLMPSLNQYYGSVNLANGCDDTHCETNAIWQ